MGFFSQRELGRSQKRIEKITQCGKCNLAHNAITPKMPVHGPGTRSILFVGDAPGKLEDKIGRPFVGDDGKVLREGLGVIGVDLSQCWASNAVCCYVPGGKVEPYMTSCCRPALTNAIQKLQPDVIVPMGLVALGSLLQGIWKKDVGTLQRWVGWQIPCEDYNAWVCPVFHPSYIRSMDDRSLFASWCKHLKAAVNKEGKPVKFTTIESLESQIQTTKSIPRAMKWLMWLSRQEGYLAFDYETTGLKPDNKHQQIVSMSFCLNGSVTFAVPYDECMLPVLKVILTSTRLKKVAANLKYEDRWTWVKLGIRVKGWFWDTMLGAHLLDNRAHITSLKFQSFVHFGVADYDSHIEPYFHASGKHGLNDIKSVNMDDLLMYNGIDSLLEYRLMKLQVKIFKQAKKGCTK